MSVLINVHACRLKILNRSSEFVRSLWCFRPCFIAQTARVILSRVTQS